MNHGCTGKRLVVLQWISYAILDNIRLARTGFHTGWRYQFQDPEKGIKTVAAHIPQSARAKMIPAAPDKR
ncbi:hypothetical protein ES703_118358 [subsurface metagenome]